MWGLFIPVFHLEICQSEVLSLSWRNFLRYQVTYLITFDESFRKLVRHYSLFIIMLLRNYSNNNIHANISEIAHLLNISNKEKSLILAIISKPSRNGDLVNTFDSPACLPKSSLSSYGDRNRGPWDQGVYKPSSQYFHIRRSIRGMEEHVTYPVGYVARRNTSG